MNARKPKHRCTKCDKPYFDDNYNGENCRTCGGLIQ